jgi:asparagine synthase (glutamine-hydrolysing)
VEADLVAERLELAQALEQIGARPVGRRMEHEVGGAHVAAVLPARKLERTFETGVDVVPERQIAAALRELPHGHDVAVGEPVEKLLIPGVREPPLGERKEESAVERLPHALHDGCMCGLCGIVHLGAPPETDAVEAMAGELDHRGPDGRGAFATAGVAFAFRRLAIIDLSDAGAQPFASEDARLQLMHNGEIYNYRQLRRDLESAGHRFRSATDTEVILRAYIQWGEACVERFNGMWAFALWDDERQRLFCSRDRFGIKPFYYRHAGTRFSFASEPRSFRRLARLEANPDAVHEYLEQGYLDHLDETFFRGVRRLPPAHSLVFDESGLRIWRHWRLEEREPPADAVEEFFELFRDSIRLELRSDVPIGTALSGGLDSSAVAVSASDLLRTEAENAEALGGRQRTFTAYFGHPGYDERPFAEAVVAQTGAEATWVTFDASELVDDLPRIVEAQGEPFGSTSICAGWYVMRAAKAGGVKVLLDGQGGDELLAGYRAHFGFRLADLLARGRVRELRAELAGTQHGPVALATSVARPFAPEGLVRAVRARTRGSLAHPELRGPGGADFDGSPFPDRLRRYQQLVLTRRGLPELLRYEDRNSMAHSLEARVPFLDHRLVELCFSLPPHELIRGGETKSVLRRALGELLPPQVRDRRDKLGFVTPEADWLRGPLGELAGDVFASQSVRDRGFVDAPAARRRLERHRTGRLTAGMELWRALNLELWARAYLDG